MSNGLSYEQVVERLPAYTLGALEPDELLAVEDYLEQQRALMARIERLHLATAQLAHAAPDVPPLSPRIKSALMTRARAEAAPSVQTASAQRSAVSSVTPPVGAPGAPTARNPLFAGRNPTSRAPWGSLPQSRSRQPPAPPQPRRFTFTFGWLAAAAMAVAAFFIIWIDIGAQRQLGQLQAELAARTTELATLSQQLEMLEEQLQRDRAQLAFFANPTQIVPLTGTVEAPNAAGIFYQHNEEALLLLHGLPPLPTDQAYQLWLIPAEGAPASAGLLTVESTDINHQQVNLPIDALAYSAVGISVEPAGGSPAPTGDIVLLGERT